MTRLLLLAALFLLPFEAARSRSARPARGTLLLLIGGGPRTDDIVQAALRNVVLITDGAVHDCHPYDTLVRGQHFDLATRSVGP